jgi:TAG lipase / steryl ester hydrolase / phospholipase A2 / LPA acyltransferase
MAQSPSNRRLNTSPLREAAAAMAVAESAGAWLEAATAFDALTGMVAWREDDESPHYDAALLRSECLMLAKLRADGDGVALGRALEESLNRHLADITAPELHGWALTGTKRLVTAYLDEVEACLRWLAQTPLATISREEKRRRFEQSSRVYGRSALMLSGGATWGFYHFGVVKALFKEGLLPSILSGASTGAMIAAGVCARTNSELTSLFDNPDQVRLDGLLPVGPRAALRQRALLDANQLMEVLRHNVGEWTFAEAHARSGRTLNISVSPTRTRQKPRVLSHVTAPDVLIARAALASSALPGLFPPVVLEAKDATGRIVPYVPSERWVDGSIYEDLPKLRLARLHNVNHFIVSQANPHVVPFVRHHGQRGLLPAIAGITSATVRTQGAYAIDLASRVTRPGRGPLSQLADRAQALVRQDYRGDIDIHPRFRLDLLRKVVVNPSPEDLREFIREGERATWPKLAMIRDHTRLGRVFRECVESLQD